MTKLSILFFLMMIISPLFSQEEKAAKIVFDENANQDVLIGYCTTDILKASPVAYWFDSEYDSYSVDNGTLSEINPGLMPELEVLIVLGTWCSDSQREVPGFIKIAESLDMDPGQITILGVDSNKTAGKVPVSRMNIELVPTFIFYYEGDEVGRIIESPEESLERDLVKIVSSI